MLLAPKLSDGHSLVASSDDLTTMVAELRGKTVGVDFETSGLRYWDGQAPIAYSVGYWAGNRPRVWYVPVAHLSVEPQVPMDPAKLAFSDALKGAREIVGHNLKFDINMARADGWEFPKWTTIHDTMIQAYLIEEGRPLQLEKLVMQLGVSPYGDALEMKDEVEGWIQSRCKALRISRRQYLDKFGHSEVPIALESEYACRDIGHTLALDRHQRNAARGESESYSDSRFELYDNEMLLVRALADMEFSGQRVDCQYLERVKVQLENELAEGGGELASIFGVDLAWNNERAIRDLIYKQLKFPVLKRTKRGQPAVDKAALSVFANKHKGIEPLLEWRARHKILTTYTTSLIEKADGGGIVHPSFMQTGAASGRMSSSKPNFQNVPSRHPILSPLVRKAFVIDPGKARIYCDYSQIELRMLAWITGNETLLSAYQSDAYDRFVDQTTTYDLYRHERKSEDSADIHALVAEKVFGASPKDPDWKRKRSAAKVINFGVPYGGGPNLLISNPELRLSERQAKAYHRAYHDRNPEVEKTRAALLRSMRRDSRLSFTNWSSRKRHGKRLVWADENVVADEERSMFACLVQGSAAELTRWSLVRLWLLQQTGKLPAVTTSTVHDEIQVDCDASDSAEVALIVQREMEDFTGLFGSVPVIADLEITKTTWAAKEGYTP